jgi:TonB family protein
MDVRLAPGSIFAGEYRVLSPLAEGGMGAVYVVEQVSTGRRRALKIMHPELMSDPRSRARFMQEATIGARVDSEHIVEVVAAGVDASSSMPFLAMELLEGQSLADQIEKQGPLSLEGARALLTQLVHGLAAAHRSNVVHRDLKPENVFLARSRRSDSTFVVKLLDFGISKLLQDARTARGTQAIGSPLWMAPEQMDPAQNVTPATDVWSLGLLVYWMLTGTSYWRAARASEIPLTALLAEIVVQPLARASERAREVNAHHLLPPEFDVWFAHTVTRPPRDRFADAAQAFAALEPSLRSAPSILTPSPIAPTAVLTSPAPTDPAPRVASTVALPPPAEPPARASRRSPLVVIGAGVLALAAAAAAAIGFFALREDIEIPLRPAPSIAVGSMVCVRGNELRCDRVSADDESARELNATPQPVFEQASARVAVGASELCAVGAESGLVRCAELISNEHRLGLRRGDPPEPPTLRDDSPPLRIANEHPSDLVCTASGCCAISTRGEVECWGTRGNGAAPSWLGDTGADVAPRGIALPGPARRLAVGPLGIACAILGGGELYCWGRGARERPGLEAREGIGDLEPREMTGLEGGPFLDVAIDISRICVIGEDHGVRCAAEDGKGLASPLTGAVALTAGTEHMCARLEDRSVRCWGENSRGQVGLGRTGTPVLAPAEPDGLGPVREIAAGAWMTCALREDAAIWCWGEVYADQSDRLTSVAIARPTPIVRRSEVSSARDRARREAEAHGVLGALRDMTASWARDGGPAPSRGAPAAPRDDVVPRIRTGDADVRGSLSRELVRRVVQRHINEVRFCYEQGLMRRPELVGQIAVAFVITASGSVASASVARSTLADPPVEGCITTAVRRWYFPAPEGGGTVSVHYPFDLSTAPR